MRPGLLPDNPLERIAIRMNLAPVPDGHAMFGMPMSRVTIAGVRMGVFERLARGPATAEEVARDIGAHAEGTLLLLESLAALDQVERERGSTRSAVPGANGSTRPRTPTSAHTSRTASTTGSGGPGWRT